MRTIFLDAETYYDREYSLRNMTPVEYILHPRFEMIGLAVKKGEEDPYWLEGPEVPHFFSRQDPNKTIMVTYNALFDACIFAWRYNFVPKLMVDAMGMARARLSAQLKSFSLASVATHLGVGIKGDAIENAMGMNLAALKMTPFYARDYIPYALNDVKMCADIYHKLILDFPLHELLVQDMVLRCAVKPKFVLDQHVLAQHLGAVQAQKLFLLDALGGIPKEELMSNEKFANLLLQHGITPGVKTSKTTGKETWAFAKTDPFMVSLEEHENPMIQALVAARLGHKSTLEETRTQRLISISNLFWPTTWDISESKKLMPIPLRNSGAHTHRLSGEWKLNFQNIPRNSPLRRALMAPPGYTVVAADAKQIEARGVACLCNEEELTKKFEDGVDVYCDFASKLFSREVTKSDVGERFIGKTSILGLGFGAGWRTLQNAIRIQSKAQLGAEMKVSDEDAAKFVSIYRRAHPGVKRTWNFLNNTGIRVLLGEVVPTEWHSCWIDKEEVTLPSGLKLYYPGLNERPYTYETGDVEGDTKRVFEFYFAGKHEHLYGGKLLENIVQALAREITMSAGVRITKRLGEDLALQVHDELVFVVPDCKVQLVKDIITEEMCRRPSWAPKWPLAVDEPKTGRNYGEVK